MKRYVLTSQAQNDLRQIRDFLLREAGFRATRHVMGSIIAGFHTLTRTPGVGHKRDDLTSRDQLRFWAVFSYLIVYRVDKLPITVIAVIHGKQDVRSLLQNR
jgi:plasmid stabilization system protein ParE